MGGIIENFAARACSALSAGDDNLHVVESTYVAAGVSQCVDGACCNDGSQCACNWVVTEIDVV
jgi:hypothetical protein